MKTKSAKKISEDFSSLNLDNVYFFSGTDHLRKAKLVSILENNKMYKNNPFDFLKKEAEPKNLGDFLLDCDSPPIHCAKKVAVLKTAQKLPVAQLRDLFSYCENPADFTCLIIMYGETLNKEDAAYALVEKSSMTYCAFEEMDIFEACEFIKERFKERKIHISQENAQFLYSIAGGDSSILENEVEKISLYIFGKQEVTKSDISFCCCVYKQENPYEIMEAVVNGDKKKILSVTEKLLDSNIDPLAILSVFTIASEKLLKMAILRENGFSGDFKTAYSIGVFYREFKSFNLLRSISSQKANQLLRKCAEAENLLKTSSGRDPKILIKNIAYELNKAL